MTKMTLSLAMLTVLTFASSHGNAETDCQGDTEALLECEAPKIKMFLQSWVSAWADGDVEHYLSHYTEGRSPRTGFTREAWESHRRARISPDQDIEIDLKLESIGREDSGIFDVVFIQHYRSESYEDQVRKRLFLLPEAGEFRIFKEESFN